MAYLIIAIAYLIGSIPTAYLAGRRLKGQDIREMGDGNVGAQNAFRHLEPRTGVAVGFIDAGKGALAVLIAQAAGLPLLGVMLAGVAAIIGHNFPAFLGFRGGRGESTTIGVFLVMLTQPMLIASLLALVTLLRSKNVILASVVLFVSLPLAGWWLGLSGQLIAYSIALPGLVGVTHYTRTRQKAMRPA
jgi:glycerol-3-phosphate acyltransferase PlsY